MSPELQRANAQHRLFTEHNIDAETIRHIISTFRYELIENLPRMADEIIDYLIEATS